MKCDELKDRWFTAYPTEGICKAKVYGKKEVDEAIAELKDKIKQKDFFWDGCGFSKMGFKNTIDVANYVVNLKAENIELQSFYDLHGNVDNYIDKLKAENESLEEENKKLVFALSEAVQKQGFKNLNIPESLFKSMEKIAEVRGENQKYIEQLRGEVSKWHKAYDALLDERNSLAHELHNIKKTLTEGV